MFEIPQKLEISTVEGKSGNANKLFDKLNPSQKKVLNQIYILIIVVISSEHAKMHLQIDINNFLVS